jgi:hypothetical protein
MRQHRLPADFKRYYGYPKDEALKVAVSAIKDFLYGHDLDVYLAVFDRASFAVSEKLLGEVASYIDEHYAEEHMVKRRRLSDAERPDVDEAGLIRHSVSNYMVAESLAAAPAAGLDDLVGNLDEPFSATLMRMIDARGKTDVEVYKRANIDRKLFSKSEPVRDICRASAQPSHLQ